MKRSNTGLRNGPGSSPVFVAANKEISMTRETLCPDELTLPPLVECRPADPGEPFMPFRIGADRPVPELVDRPLSTGSLGWTRSRSPGLPPGSTVAGLAIPSLTFIRVEVPLPDGRDRRFTLTL